MALTLMMKNLFHCEQLSCQSALKSHSVRALAFCKQSSRYFKVSTYTSVVVMQGTCFLQSSSYKKGIECLLMCGLHTYYCTVCSASQLFRAIWMPFLASQCLTCLHQTAKTNLARVCCHSCTQLLCFGFCNKRSMHCVCTPLGQVFISHSVSAFRDVNLVQL